MTQPEFTTTCSFAAPPAVVWDAFTSAEALRQWWGPKGCTIDVLTLDVRPGGHFHYAMTLPGGVKMYGRFEYRELQAPARMVFVNAFSDAAGGVARAPWSATWPLEVLNTLTLAKDGIRTMLTLRGTPLNANPVELLTFNAGQLSMTQGFSGTWDQLATYLKARKE